MVVKKKTRKQGKRAPSLHVTSASQFGALKSLMGKSPIILVLVYADWCGHCQHFKPDWRSLEKLPSRNMPMVSIKDDVFPKSPLNNMVTAEGYPTVAVVKPSANLAVNLPTREKTKLTNVVTNAPMLSESPENLNSNVKNVLSSNGIATNNYVNTENMYPENSMENGKSKSTPKPISNNLPVMPSVAPSPPKSEIDYLRDMGDEESETPSATDYAKYPVKSGSQAGGGRNSGMEVGSALMTAGSNLIKAGGFLMKPNNSMSGGLWDGITNYVNHKNGSMTRKRKNRRNRSRRA